MFLEERMAGGKAPRLVGKIMSNVCKVLRGKKKMCFSQTAQTHLLLSTDLAGELLTGAAQSNETARFTYMPQKDLY